METLTICANQSLLKTLMEIQLVLFVFVDVCFRVSLFQNR